MPRQLGANKAIKELPITSKRFLRWTKDKKLIKNPQYRGGGAWENPLHYVDTYAYYYKGQPKRWDFQLKRRDAIKQSISMRVIAPRKWSSR